MNRKRRQRLAEAVEELATAFSNASDHLQALHSAFEAARFEFEAVKDEEQEALDNLPESIQNGERGSTMQEIIDGLDSQMSELEERETESQSLIDNVESIIEAVRAYAEG